MLVGVAPLPLSFPPSGTFYIIDRPNCIKISNTVYLKIWEWELIFGRAVMAISSLGVLSPLNRNFVRKVRCFLKEPFCLEALNNKQRPIYLYISIFTRLILLSRNAKIFLRLIKGFNTLFNVILRIARNLLEIKIST